MHLSCIVLLAAAAAAVAAVPCAAHLSDFDKRESRLPITERSAVDGRDGTAVSQARNFTSGEERMMPGSSNSVVITAEEAAEKAVRIINDLFRSHNGEVEHVNVEAVKRYMLLHPSSKHNVKALVLANESDQLTLASVLRKNILTMEELLRLNPKEYMAVAIRGREHNPVKVVLHLMQKSDFDLSDDRWVRLLTNYVDNWNKIHGKGDQKVTLDSVMSEAYDIIAKNAR